MKVQPFLMERWQSTWENVVAYNLSESGVHPMTLGEVLGPDALAALSDVALGYTQSNGTLGLRAAIAALYPGAGVDNILVSNGGSEANYVSAWAMLEPGDEVALMWPNYQQLEGVVRALGAVVKPLPLDESRGWAVDQAALAEAIGPRTRLIAVCNPNNPSGVALSAGDMQAIVKAADRVGAWILADEIYRGAERLTETETPSFWGLYERVLITSGMSKAYGLPGLRIGWVVAPSDVASRLWGYRDYTSIAPGALSDAIATIALSQDVRPRILARTRGIIRANYPILEQWARATGVFTWTPPDAGAIVMVRFTQPDHSGHPISTLDWAERLRVEQDVLVVPGAQFGVEGTLRLGFGADPASLREALARVSLLL